MNDTTLLFLSIPIALATSAYVTVVHSRYSKFQELKKEALRVIRSIDFIQEGQTLKIFNNEEVKNLVLVSSDLISLGHLNAAILINEIQSYIHEISIHSQAGRLNADVFNINFSQWQKMVREMSPNKYALWLWK